MKMDDVILKVKNICKYYPGVKALDGVTFDVKRGEVHAICGENGAGKSTFIKILTGANEPTEGTVEFKGKEYEKLTPRLAMELGISVIYQEFSLIPYLSVAENIFYGREIKKGIIRDITAMEAQAKELCKEMGVEIDVRKRVCDLGIAYQQIVEILKAVSKKSEFENHNFISGY
ncbi:MAG: ATP-binding cassette domain-containing protein [Blautia sp.]